jgi:lipopolysaccharide biosynthesis glycosyltransferase
VHGKCTLFNLSSKQLISNGKLLVLWPDVDLVMTGKVSFFNDAVIVWEYLASVVDDRKIRSIGRGNLS